MNICFNSQFIQEIIQEIESINLLTYLALVLAYLAYIRSVNRNFDSWKSLFVSFKKDLESQSAWLKNEYFKETYKDKNSYSPSKIIYPLSFESLPEIIRRGVDELPGISEGFINQLSIFNERVIAFNSALDQVKLICSADPIKSEILKDKLNELGLDKKSVEFGELKSKIFSLKKKDEIFYLAENIHRLHKVIHTKLIGNKSRQDGLHYLYSKIIKEVNNILDNFDQKRPFFIRHQAFIIATSISLFVLIEILLK